MKKINLLFTMLLIATMGLFTSCEQDNTSSTIDVSGITEGAVVAPGSTVKAVIAITDKDKLGKIEITPSVTGATGTKVTCADLDTDGMTFKSGLTTTTVNYDYVVPATDKVTLTIKFTDGAKTAHDTTLTYMIKVGKALKAEKSTTLGGSTSAKGSYYASIDGVAYTGSTAGSNASKIDLIFKNNTLYAPNDAAVDVNTTTFPSGTRNATKIGKLTGVDYGTVTTDADFGTYVASATGSSQAVAVNDILVFKTASTSAYASAIAIAKVTALANDEITIAVKLQDKGTTKVMTLRASSK